MLADPLGGVRDWTSYFAHLQIPILRRTARALAAFAGDEEAISARDVATLIIDDPLATTRLFAYLAQHRSQRQLTEITSVEGAVVMSGVPPVLNQFSGAPEIESELCGRPQAMRGLLRVVRRARRAAGFAWRFAAWRNGHDASAMATAALLHEFIEILLWASAPDLALRIAAMQRADPTLRSRTAQQLVLNVELDELRYELAQAWQLPELYQEAMHATATSHPRALLVLQAVNLARHSATGWHNPALPEDFLAIATLLNTRVDRVRAMVEPNGLAATGVSACAPPADASGATPLAAAA